MTNFYVHYSLQCDIQRTEAKTFLLYVQGVSKKVTVLKLPHYLLSI